MSDRIAVMMDGEILQCATPEIIYEDPDDIRVAEFIGSPKINILPIEQSGAELYLFGRPLKWRGIGESTRAMQMGLRPEALRLTKSAPSFKGRVAHIENLGAEIFAQIALNDEGLRVTLRASPADRPMVELGAEVGLGFDVDSALIFDADGKRMRKIEVMAGLTPEAA